MRARSDHAALRASTSSGLSVASGLPRNDKEEVWVEAPTGNVLAECFFKAPDETPEELEHMGYAQLLHLYAPEEILVGPGIAPEEVEELFVEA